METSIDVEKVIINISKKHFNIDDIDTNTNFFTDLQSTTFDIVEIIVKVEEALHMQIKDDMIEEIDSVESLAEASSRCLL